MSKTTVIRGIARPKSMPSLLEATSAQPSRGKIIWLLLKYQIVTKALLYVAIVPGFTALVKLLIISTGQTAIANGDYWTFLLSAQGVS